jgi:hypothetical protein
MPRYIDADALIEALRVDYDREGARADEMAIKGIADASVKYSHGQFCYLNAIERVKDANTVDVVPKSEVEKIFDEIESKKIFLADKTGKIGVVVKIKDIDELKKKYTVGNNETSKQVQKK